MPRYRIEAMHEVYCDYIVEADSEKEAVEKLCCAEELWTAYVGEPVSFGPDDTVLARHDIEIDTSESWISGATTWRRQDRPDFKVTEEDASVAVLRS